MTGASPLDPLDADRARDRPEEALDALEQRVFGAAPDAASDSDDADADAGPGPADGSAFAVDLDPEDQGTAAAAARNPD